MKKILAVLLCVCLTVSMSGCITIEIKTKGDENSPSVSSDTGTGSQNGKSDNTGDSNLKEINGDSEKNKNTGGGMSSEELVDAVGMLSSGGYWDCPAQWNDYKLYFSVFSGNQCIVKMQKVGDNEKGDWAVLEDISCEITGGTEDKANNVWHFTLHTPGREDINSLDVTYDRLEEGYINADNYLDSNTVHGTVEYIFVEG